MVKLGDLTISSDCKKAELKISDEFNLDLHLSESLPSATSVTTESANKIIAVFEPDNVKLEISKSEEDELQFYNFSWFNFGNLQFLKDTVYLGNVEDNQWFGGPNLLQQSHPLMKTELKKGYEFCPYVILDTFMKPASGGERYWISSKKVAIFVPSAIPLWTKLSDNGYLALQAQYDDSPYQYLPVSLSLIR